MPIAYLVALILSLLLCGEAAAICNCAQEDPQSEQIRAVDLPSDGSVERWSSFRGIGLSSRPEQLRGIAHALGLDTRTSFPVGDQTTVSGVDICKDGETIGHAAFDPKGNMLRLWLKDHFFSDKPIFVRDFADALFERYKVRQAEDDDDNCFQTMTCFKGRSAYGEEFLIMRFGKQAELFVRPATRPPASY